MTNYEIEIIMKRKNFVRDIDGWRRNFVFITIENGQWKIGHTMGFNVIRTTNIEYEDMDKWINYFDRI